MIRVIVTGATGFLGSHVVKYYLEYGAVVLAIGHHNILTIDNKSFSPRFEFLRLDICDPSKNLDIFTGYDLVIHAAAMIRANTKEERIQQKRINIDGTRNIVAACRQNGIRRLLYVSTTGAIGISPDPTMPADENFYYNLEHLNSGYYSTKRHAEQLVLDANCSSLETLVVNPSFIFGPNNGGYRGEETIRPALDKNFIICTNGGLSIVHISDVVEGIRKAAEFGFPGERYILSGDNMSFPDIAQTVAEKAGKPLKILVIPDFVRFFFGMIYGLISRLRHRPPPLHLSRYYAWQFYSSAKARREFDYKSRSFREIIADYIENTKGTFS